MKLLVVALLLALAGPAESRPLHTFRDIAYGPDAQQRFDVYAPADAHDAPVIFMVHGGAWRIGDKAMPRMFENKVHYWVPKGYVFISVNYRMLPAADPLEQARDVARALATAEEKAKEWGGDRRKFILMGHSAGAQIVALIASSSQFATELRGATWRGAVLLDSAALDVARVMRRRHLPLYDAAFGSSRSFWRQTSPYDQLRARTEPFLAVCSTRHDDACPQAFDFVAKAKSFGTRAGVLQENLTHEQINETLGEESAYTDAVDRFIRSALAVTGRGLESPRHTRGT